MSLSTSLSEICLVLTFLSSRPHPWLVEKVWACHTPVDVVSSELLLEAGGGPWKQKVQNAPFPWQISGGCPVPVHNPQPRGAWGFQGLIWDQPSGKLPGNRSQPMTQSLCPAYLLLGPFIWYPIPYPARLVFANCFSKLNVLLRGILQSTTMMHRNCSQRSSSEQ